MRYTDWIAAAAFAISMAALLSNLALMWLKWPRIVVEVAVRHGGHGTDGSSRTEEMRVGDVFLLTVTNNGSEPVTVTSVGLSRAGHRSHRLDYLDTWRGPTTAGLPIVHGQDQNLAMPVRVDGHACHVFEYPESVLAGLPAGERYHGYAKRYKAFRWWPNRPLVSETRSRHSVMRRA